MAQYKIIIDKEDLHQLFNQDQGMARLLEKVLNKVLEAEGTHKLQAAPYERCESRQGYRNGYRERGLKTRVGTLKLLVPRARSGHFSTELFSRYQRSEQALVLALMEMVINGVSTRKVRMDCTPFDGQQKHMVNWTSERGKGNGKAVQCGV